MRRTVERMSHKWMFRGNLTYNNYTESCGATAFADPTAALPVSTVVSGGPGRCPGGQVAPQSAGSGAFGNDFINAKWNVNLTGAYIMPWDINLGASLAARQGYPRPFRSNVTGLPGGTIKDGDCYALNNAVAPTAPIPYPGWSATRRETSTARLKWAAAPVAEATVAGRCSS